MSLFHPEPTAYDVKFRLFGVPVRVHPAFWLVHGTIGLLFAQIGGASVFFLWVGCVFVSILVHELGHVFAGRAFGADGEIVLTILGGLAIGSSDLHVRWHRIIVYLAGPAAQLLLAGILWLILAPMGDESPAAGAFSRYVFLTLNVLMGINVSWPLFNLLPIPPLDGGQVARELIHWHRFGDPAPWQQDANWWKRSSSGLTQEEAAVWRRRLLWTGVLVGGVLVFFWIQRADKRRQQHQAYAKLTQLGGVFGWDGRDKYYGVNLRHRDIGDEEAAQLEFFGDLQNLDLGATRISDAGVAHLGGLHKLESLYLSDTQVGDEGLAYLRDLRRIRALQLSGTKVTDAGLEHLRNMQRLEWLTLSRTGITDAGLIHLTVLPRLRYLHLKGTAVTAAGMIELLRALPALVINPAEGYDDGEENDRAAASGRTPAKAEAPDYRAVADWPQLPTGMKLGPVSAVATDSAGRVFVLQRAQPPVLVFDRGGRFLRSWGEGLTKNPHGLRIDGEDFVWLTDTGHHLVMKFDADGKLLLTLGKKDQPGDGPDQFNRPTDVAVAPSGEVYVSDGYGNSRVVKFSKEGKFLKEWGKKGKGPGEFHLPHSICLDARGRVCVGDRENNRVQVFDADGRFLAQWRESGAPFGLWPGKDRLFVADGRAEWIMVLDLNGKPLGRWSTGPGDDKAPHWVCVDRQGAVYVAYVGGKRVRKFVAK